MFSKMIKWFMEWKFIKALFGGRDKNSSGDA